MCYVKSAAKFLVYIFQVARVQEYTKVFQCITANRRLDGCRIKANSPIVRFEPTGGVLSVVGLSKPME